ncbi:MAG: cobalamin-independent methionine synthase II family protein [Janthinobacterium lividum]
MADRILTTHVGSLPRPKNVSDMLFAREAGESVDPQAFADTVAEAVRDVVARQRAAGVDIPSDGEMSKISYATYIGERLTGFSGDSERRIPADLLLVPSYAKRLAGSGGTPSYKRPCCTGDIAVRTMEPLHADIARFQAALSASGYAEGFMNAAAPGVISLFQPNKHYRDDDAYLGALADAMAAEFRGIVDAGLILQVDSPDLALGRQTMYAHLTEDEFIHRIGAHVAALNAALAGIPPERVRLHLCWGNYEGPHTLDVPIARLLPTVLGIHAGFLSFEGANPRHAHEWRVFEEIHLPEDKCIIPGVLDSSTNYVEHPDLVAERLLNYAGLVGRDRVIGGSDCGFSTFAGFGVVDPDIVWMKLATLAEGARRASAILWKH